MKQNIDNNIAKAHKATGTHYCLLKKYSSIPLALKITLYRSHKRMLDKFLPMLQKTNFNNIQVAQNKTWECFWVLPTVHESLTSSSELKFHWSKIMLPNLQKIFTHKVWDQIISLWKGWEITQRLQLSLVWTTSFFVLHSDEAILYNLVMKLRFKPSKMKSIPK